MTLPATPRRNDYTGNNSTATYSYGFKIVDDSELRVTVRNPDTDLETELTLTTHYTVTGVGESSGGTIVLVNGSFDWISTSGYLDASWALTIRRIKALSQEADIRNQGSSYREDIEDALDKSAAVDQQQQDEIDRCVKLPETISNVDATLPAPSASSYLRWNEDADGIENAEAVDLGATVLSSSEPTALTASGTGASGSSSDVSRADHRHGMPLSGALNWTGIHSHTKIQKWAKGADVASAGALTLGDDGNYFDITGTTAITSIGTKGVGTVVKLHFDAVLTLTHHATDLILPGGANIVTATGDEAEFIEYASGDWRCTSYTKASGLSVISTSVASQSEMEAASDNAKMVTPLAVKWNPGVAKFWAIFNGTGTPTLLASHNVDASITDNGTCDYTLSITTDFSSANYCTAGMTTLAGGAAMMVVISTDTAPTAGAMRVETFAHDNSQGTDPAKVCIVGFGDQ